MLGSGVDPPVGPAREQTADRPTDQEFLKVLAPLSRGELFFPPPFDYGSATALADNELTEIAAVRLFQQMLSRQRLRYDVTLTVRSEDAPAIPPRTIVTHTANGPEVLAALLGGLLMELEAATMYDDTEEG